MAAPPTEAANNGDDTEPHPPPPHTDSSNEEDYEDVDDDEELDEDDEIDEDEFDEDEDEEYHDEHDFEDIIENMAEDSDFDGDGIAGSAAQLYYILTEGGILGHRFTRRQRREPPDPNRFPKIPSEKGAELMASGLFGMNDTASFSGPNKRQKHTALRVLNRELGLDSARQNTTTQALISQGLVPSSTPDTIISYDEPVYSGQFSDDGNFFYACVKDFKVRMYDTSNPYKWKYYKTVSYPMGRWTLTDATLSPDNRFLAYTSIHSTVCFAPTDPNDHGEPYDLDLSGRSSPGYVPQPGHDDNFGIWSLRYSGDGTELVAGTSSESIVVYDIESRQQVLATKGHDNDVNAVCFADKANSNILFSGSDDTTIKVWDRRSMGDSREAGAFIGHTEGVTYIDSKGDGRYCLSNGKDQTMKLWDLRTMMTTAQFSRIDPVDYTTNYDYRWGDYDEDDWKPHPHDNSVVTFRGHKVAKTLIRCHFSPPGSTNSKYVYTGSADGKVYIYNLDATIHKVINVRGGPAHRLFQDEGDDSDPESSDDDPYSRPSACVRDVSWHPNAPIIAGKLFICIVSSIWLTVVASAWNGVQMSEGTVTVHSWNLNEEEDDAEPKMGIRLNDRLREIPKNRNRAHRRRRFLW